MFNEFNYSYDDNEPLPLFYAQQSKESLFNNEYENNDYLISNAVSNIKSLFSQKKFEDMINYLNYNYKNFLMARKEILYFIMKFQFYSLLQNIPELAENYYFEFFQIIVKEVKGVKFEIKNNIFLKILKNPELIKNLNLVEHFYNNFIFNFTREITNYIYNPDINLLKNTTSDSLTIYNIDSLNSNQNEQNEQNEDNCNQLEDKQLSRMSTMEVISDDEFISNAPCNAETEIVNNAGPIAQNNNINNLLFPPSNAAVTYNPLKDKSSNYYILQKPYIPKIKKNQETIKELFPLLKLFKPKYTKRENIDKKIIRKFKSFLKEKYKSKSLNLNNSDKNFWIMFINGNILPPINYLDNNTNEYVNFKSFNSKFLQWLFEKKGANLFYEEFIQHEFNNLLTSLIEEYGILLNQEIDQLKFYTKNLASIFRKEHNAPNPSDAVLRNHYILEDDDLRLKFRERSREFDLFDSKIDDYLNYDSDHQE